MVGLPPHPATGVPTQIYEYQMEYFNAWNTAHKLMLNKSRKIGATEIALRIIAYNCFTGKYANHKVMIVAGNSQDVANTFIERFKGIFSNGFKDLSGYYWTFDDLVRKDSMKELKLIDNIDIEAYPANEAVRGIANVKCVFMSECAFINRLDDTRVYNALHPNVANIPDADFIMESTPNGRRGFFWENWSESSEYTKIEQPYNVSLNKLITPEFIAREKANPKIDFRQEYCCDFTTSNTAAFDKDKVDNIYESKPINDYSEILNQE